MSINVEGEKVVHSKYGEGVIISVRDEKWEIDFGGIVKTIVYDVVLGKNLKFVNSLVESRLLNDRKEQKENAAEIREMHKSVWQCNDMFGNILKLCKENSKRLQNPNYINELVSYFSINKKMNNEEEVDFRKALQILSEKKIEEFPIYPVVLINTSSSEGEFYYVIKIMDDKKKKIELTYHDLELQNAINILAYWCVINEQTTIRRATTITEYTRHATSTEYFEKAVMPAIQKLAYEDVGERYMDNIEGTLKIGDEYYRGYFYRVKRCNSYILWGGHSEFGNGSNASIEYILPIKSDYYSKYYLAKARDYLYEKRKKEYQKRKNLLGTGIIHPQWGYGRITDIYSEDYARITFYEEKSVININFTELLEKDSIIILDQESNKIEQEKICRVYNESLKGKKLHLLYGESNYRYYGNIDRFEDGRIYLSDTNNSFLRCFRYPEDEIEGKILIV